MADTNLGDLFFTLGLKEDEFEKTWKNLLNRCQKEANIKLKVSIDDSALSGIKTTLNKMQGSLSKGDNIFTDKSSIKSLNAELDKTNGRLNEATKNLKNSSSWAKNLDESINSGSGHAKNLNENFLTQSKIVGEIKNKIMSYVGLMGGVALFNSLIKIRGEFEYQLVSLRSIMQNVSLANSLFKDLQGLALKSPYYFKDLISFTKQLSAFSIPNKELFSTVKMLGDVASGLGVSMDRIILAYGQIRAASFLRGQGVRQLTEAGIPILEELAKKFTEITGKVVSAGEVFNKISARQVPFAMVEQVFKDMTTEGGKFYNMQAIQTETLRGKVLMLKDAYQIMMNNIGESSSGILKGSVDSIWSLMANYESVGKTILELAITYGVLKAATIALTKARLLEITAIEGQKVAAVLLDDTLGQLNKKLVVTPNAYALIASAIALVTVGIYKLITATSAIDRIHNELTKSTNELYSQLNIEGMNLDLLYTKLRLAKKGTEEYDNAKQAIIRAYPDYFNKLLEEGKLVGDMEDHYKALKKAITESVDARINADAKKNLSDAFQKEADVYIGAEAEKNLNRSLTGTNLTSLPLLGAFYTRNIMY